MSASPDPSAQTAESINKSGEAKRLKGDLDGALADFNKAIELKPDFAPAYNNRALLKKAKKDVVGALADYDKAISLKPELATFHMNRGELKRVSGDLDGALVDFNRSIELKRDSPVAHNNRGLAKQSKGDLDGALKDFDKAIELKPDLGPAYSNRSLVKKARGDLAGAEADKDKALELKPESAETCYQRGLGKMEKRDWAGAVAHFNRALELNPAFANAYCNRGASKNAMGDSDGALADLKKSLEFEPNSPGIKEIIRVITKQAKAVAKKTAAPIAQTKKKKIPATEKAVLLRTDFSNDAAWKSLRAIIQDPDADFQANVEIIDTPEYAGVTATELLSLLSDESGPCAFIVDHAALSEPEQPILVVDLLEERGRTFRVLARALWQVENNLSIGNMGFDEFLAALDEKKIFRGLS